jgi:hypothetical protein
LNFNLNPYGGQALGAIGFLKREGNLRCRGCSFLVPMQLRFPLTFQIQEDHQSSILI